MVFYLFISVSKGLHYIGQLHETSFFRIVMDQITEGQLQFVELDKHFDTIIIGTGEERRKYTIYTGKTEMEEHLKKQFPNDVKAVEEFFKIMKVVCGADHEIRSSWNGTEHLESSRVRQF